MESRAGGQTKRRTLSRRSLLGSSVTGLTALAAISLVEACGGTSAPSAAGTATPTSAPTQKLKLVGVYPLTGSSANNGQISKRGAELAVSQLNEAGGFRDEKGNRYQLEISANDYGDNKNEAIAVVRGAAGDSSVLAIIGPLSSVGFVPAVPVADQLKIPMFGIGSLATIDPPSTWVYRLNAISAIATPQMLKLLVPKLGIRNIALMYDQTNDGQVSDAKVVRAQADVVGYRLVADETYRGGEQDFSAILAKVKASKPDALWLASQTAEIARIVKQWSSAGGTAPVMTTNGVFNIPAVWDESNGLVKGGYTYEPIVPGNALDKFTEDYKKAYAGASPAIHAIVSYDAVHVVVAAVKKASTVTDREAVRAVLASLDTTTQLGTRVVFKNPPNGENLAATVSIVRTTGRGTYEVVK